MTSPLKNSISPNERGIWTMLRPKSVWVKWKEKRKRWEVGVQWHGKPERFDQFQGIPHISREIAEEHASEIRTEIRKGTLDPEKHKKRGRRKSLYLFGEYAALWLQGYDEKIQTGDISRLYVDDLKRYNDLYF